MTGSVTIRRRALRAVTFALVLTASAVLAHVIAGGLAPSVTVIAGSAGAMLAVGWALSGRDLAASALGAVAVIGQLMLHVGFCLTMPGDATMASMFCGRPSEPTPVGLVRIRLAQPGVTATSHQMLLMMLAHACGGALVLLAMRSAEAVAAVIAGVLTAVLLWARPAAHVPAARGRLRSGPVFRVRTSALFVVSPRRGPPVFVCS